MDDETETYKLWRIRKTIMQVQCDFTFHLFTYFILSLVNRGLCRSAGIGDVKNVKLSHLKINSIV